MRSGPSHGRSTLIAITALAVVMTSACLREKNTSPGLAAVSRDYPAVDGSTSTHPLGVLLACKALGVPYEWRTPPASERTVFPARDTHPLSAAQIEREIQHHGTHQAYMESDQPRSGPDPGRSRPVHGRAERSPGRWHCPGCTPDSP